MHISGTSSEPMSTILMVTVMHPLDYVAWYAGGTFRYLHHVNHHIWCSYIAKKYTAAILNKLDGGSVGQICADCIDNTSGSLSDVLNDNSINICYSR